MKLSKLNIDVNAFLLSLSVHLQKDNTENDDDILFIKTFIDELLSDLKITNRYDLDITRYYKCLCSIRRLHPDLRFNEEQDFLKIVYKDIDRCIKSTCDICYNVTKIYKPKCCNKKHTICKTCWDRCTNCPFCRNDDIPIRYILKKSPKTKKKIPEVDTVYELCTNISKWLKEYDCDADNIYDPEFYNMTIVVLNLLDNKEVQEQLVSKENKIKTIRYYGIVYAFGKYDEKTNEEINKIYSKLEQLINNN